MSVNNISPCRRKKIEQPCDALSSSQEINKCVARLCHGDLYAIGLIWIQSLRSVLVGAKFITPFSTIYAAQAQKDPERPPPMRPSELPAYFSPHEAYKSFLEDKDQCESHLLHDMALPYVKHVRQNCQDVLTNVKSELCGTYNEITSDFAKTKKTMTAYWRADEHFTARRGLVATGGLLGYYIGSKGGIIRRVFCSACGVAAAGMICFPKHTDETIRNAFYHSGKALTSGFNYMTGRNLVIRERLPCPKQKPPDEKFVIMCDGKNK